MKTLFTILMIVSFFVAGKTYGQQFVYTPINPAFGGNPYNYSWMLSSAAGTERSEANYFQCLQPNHYRSAEEFRSKSEQSDFKRAFASDCCQTIWGECTCCGHLCVGRLPDKYR